MNKPIAILTAAGFLLGLLGAGGAQAASSHGKRHRTRLHHRQTTTHRAMSVRVSTARATPRRITNGHGNTIHRRGHGVYGGVFSEPTVTNNGQASADTPPSGVNGTGVDKAGSAAAAGSTR